MAEKAEMYSGTMTKKGGFRGNWLERRFVMDKRGVHYEDLGAAGLPKKGAKELGAASLPPHCSPAA